ncbi:uncharacterized protein LOC114349223 isoform X2 [Diabrotica virgifera virgifera]|uniref:Uncharacterized protein n=1 Tax=Diabrotica virgifera virgifera TaxID=50390 RepID=A0ABM5JWU5_DIAVI|nr:uncharacterized protein LOC114349223 isoform X2 [Diabrotica virgifera virgifera]
MSALNSCVRKSGGSFKTCVFILKYIIIGLRLYERVWEFITLEEPLLIEDHTGILTSYGIQIFIACLLIYGSVVESLNFTLPWLLLTAPAFLLGSLYAIVAIYKEESVQIFFNFFAVCSIWLMWLAVLQYNIKHNEFVRSMLKLQGYVRLKNEILS